MRCGLPALAGVADLYGAGVLAAFELCRLLAGVLSMTLDDVYTLVNCIFFCVHAGAFCLGMIAGILCWQVVANAIKEKDF